MFDWGKKKWYLVSKSVIKLWVELPLSKYFPSRANVDIHIFKRESTFFTKVRFGKDPNAHKLLSYLQPIMRIFEILTEFIGILKD